MGTNVYGADDAKGGEIGDVILTDDAAWSEPPRHWGKCRAAANFSSHGTSRPIAGSHA
ncbi:hypothetical protein [Mesorhizobium sp. WSM3859]|uniref:hypothetical protein n=1 Tax=Mesorhizobium sp. WSM3859 TaxID=2029402 RepID=UPI0032AF03CA